MQTSKNVEVIFYLDFDDPTKEQYPDAITLIGMERSVKSINLMGEIARGEVFLLIGDDVVFKTPGWDEKILKSVPEDKIALFSFDDGRGEKGESHPHPAITRQWYKTLGYIAWPEFKHWAVDSWLVDISKRINRLIYLEDILIHHMKVMDETAKNLRDPSKDWNVKDRLIFKNGEPIREAHADKLKQYIDQNRPDNQTPSGVPKPGMPVPSVG